MSRPGGSVTVGNLAQKREKLGGKGARPLSDWTSRPIAFPGPISSEYGFSSVLRTQRQVAAEPEGHYQIGELRGARAALPGSAPHEKITATHSWLLPNLGCSCPD